MLRLPLAEESALETEAEVAGRPAVAGFCWWREAAATRGRERVVRKVLARRKKAEANSLAVVRGCVCCSDALGQGFGGVWRVCWLVLVMEGL